ncbi:hydroxyethylthiazole kinase-like sugar kinase family protein [Xanthomonas translucens]
MAFAHINAAGDLAAHGFKGSYGGVREARVSIAIGGSPLLSMSPAEARKLSDELLVAAGAVEAAAAEIIKGNADIAQTGQVAV